MYGWLKWIIPLQHFHLVMRFHIFFLWIPYLENSVTCITIAHHSTTTTTPLTMGGDVHKHRYSRHWRRYPPNFSKSSMQVTYILFSQSSLVLQLQSGSHWCQHWRKRSIRKRQGRTRRRLHDSPWRQRPIQRQLLCPLPMTSRVTTHLTMKTS